MHCSFSLEHYKECLQLARDKGYSIIPVKDYSSFDYQYIGSEKKHSISNYDKVILLRHDIDFSLEYAYELANIEYDLGVCSSYYVYLHSPTYSALSPKSMGMIKAMKGMGHEIGLHYDSRYSLSSNMVSYRYDDEDEDHYYSIEDIALNSITDDYVSTFTQHNPSMTKIPNNMELYKLNNPNDLPIKYISDSGRNWREGCMCKHIGKVDKLHILVHPVWWVGRGNSRDEVVYNMISDLKNSLERDRLDIVKQMKEYCSDLKIEY